MKYSHSESISRDYEELKERILQTNARMINSFLQGDLKDMQMMRILLSYYIDQAIDYNKKTIQNG